MKGLPLGIRLKKRAHREIALAQDVLVTEAFDSFQSCVLHGGTAIWRCYGGTRFSEDVDAYLPGHTTQSGSRFRRGLAARGAREVKFKETPNALFATFELGGARVSFEGTLRKPPARVIRDYETVEGGIMLVATLPPEELIAEKASAYIVRRKVRDLYDVFFLLNKVENGRVTAPALEALTRGYHPPVDEAQLKAIILAGAVPSSEEMIEGIRRWVRRYT